METGITQSPILVRLFQRAVRSVTHLAIAIVLFLILRAFVVEMFKIPTSSMQGTLLAGDFLLVDKMRYGAYVPLTSYRLPAWDTPHAGDIIVFRWPVDPNINFVKRVVGVPGDTLRMQNGQLIRNGVPLTEQYVTHVAPNSDPFTDAFTWQRDFLVASLHATRSYWPSQKNWGPLIVPKGNYFVLGDNRDRSLDSRYWGFVPDSMVRGRPLFVTFSYEPDSLAQMTWLTRLRWDRIGTVVR